MCVRSDDPEASAVRAPTDSDRSTRRKRFDVRADRRACARPRAARSRRTPSEAVVAEASRGILTELFLDKPDDHGLEKSSLDHADPKRRPALQLAG
jgi:hypothetical protein